jgi:hypothetical protein
MKRPVSISPQAEALTNSESEWPMWRSHWRPPILSAISLSAVAASGMRKQRFRQAHEHHALFARQGVFLHELVDAAGLAPPAPHRLHQMARPRLGLARLAGDTRARSTSSRTTAASSASRYSAIPSRPGSSARVSWIS